MLTNKWFFKVFLWQSGVLKIAISRDIDVIVFAGIMYYFSTWVAIVFAKLTGKRVLMWTHGYLKDEKGFKGWLREKFYKLSDGLLLYGHNAKKILLRRRFDPNSLYIVYNSLDYDKQCKVRSSITPEVLSDLKNKLFSLPELPVLVYVGRLTKQKKLGMILEAAHVLANRNISVNVLFVGDGSEQAGLQEAAMQYGLQDFIKFYGPTYSEDELGPLISMSDICVAPGEVGLTCMHALVYGTPVITHNNVALQMPEFEAVIEGKTGAFFKHGSADDLAETIARWFVQIKNRNEIKCNCQALIDKFYNPYFQLSVINDAVRGMPANNREYNLFSGNRSQGGGYSVSHCNF